MVITHTSRHKVLVTREDLHVKVPELCVDRVELVDDGAEVDVFLQSVSERSGWGHLDVRPGTPAR